MEPNSKKRRDFAAHLEKTALNLLELIKHSQYDRWFYFKSSTDLFFVNDRIEWLAAKLRNFFEIDSLIFITGVVFGQLVFMFKVFNNFFSVVFLIIFELITIAFLYLPF